MSPSRPDTAFRNKRHPSKDLSAPHLRALRKELLLVRADVERVELARASFELRQAVTHFSWLRFVIPGFGGVRVGKGPKASVLNAGTIGALLKQYPVHQLDRFAVARQTAAREGRREREARAEVGQPCARRVGSVPDLATDEERVGGGAGGRGGFRYGAVAGGAGRFVAKRLLRSWPLRVAAIYRPSRSQGCVCRTSITR
ncbi:hypothetical protein OKW39_001751 [Paraburkholderia sp. MM6662-R1]